ncbi:MAG: hypothetical protein K2Q01_01925 [Rickettsiales bacterium]|nr:hypothetical protein [Rickettsiales bacterium]
MRRRLLPAPLFAALLLALSLLAAAYTGLRTPGDWTVNYFQPAWQDGIFRRALPGTLLYPFVCLRFTLGFIHALQGAIFAGLTAWLIGMGWRYGQGLVLALFFFSAAGGFYFHLIGYSDQLLWLMALAAIALARRWPWAASGVMAASLFVHEIAFAMVLPLVGAGLVLEGVRDVRQWVKLYALPVLMFGVIYWLRSDFSAYALELFTLRAKGCGFEVLRSDYYDYYINGVPAENYYATYYGAAWLQKPVAVVLLACALVVALGQKMALHWLEKLLLVGACAGLLATDTERWMMNGVLQTLMVTLLAARAAKRRGVDPSFLRTQFFLPYLLVLLFQSYAYFDGLAPRPFTEEGLSQLLDNATAGYAVPY